MIRRLRPTETAATIFDIDFEALRMLGKQALVFDFDNTLARGGSAALPSVSNQLLENLAENGFRIGILTNRWPRRTIADISFPIIYHARKPRPAGYMAMLDMLAATPNQCVMIGDRYVTDMLGGNRLGIHTIRVRWRSIDGRGSMPFKEPLQNQNSTTD